MFCYGGQTRSSARYIFVPFFFPTEKNCPAGGASTVSIVVFQEVEDVEWKVTFEQLTAKVALTDKIPLMLYCTSRNAQTVLKFEVENILPRRPGPPAEMPM
jgi:hypothetical protein